jgi:hypothetical protein
MMPFIKPSFSANPVLSLALWMKVVDPLPMAMRVLLKKEDSITLFLRSMV